MANPATLRPKVQQLQSAHSVVQQAQGAHARCTAGTAAGIPALAQPRTRLHFHMGKRISVRSARAAPRARRLGCGGCLVVRVTRVTVHEESAARDTRLLLKLLQLLDSRARHRVPDLGGLQDTSPTHRRQVRQVTPLAGSRPSYAANPTRGFIPGSPNIACLAQPSKLVPCAQCERVQDMHAELGCKVPGSLTLSLEPTPSLFAKPARQRLAASQTENSKSARWHSRSTADPRRRRRRCPARAAGRPSCRVSTLGGAPGTGGRTHTGQMFW
eukprot:358478-Chlamydomonas_euryale.AAC.19